ILRIFGKHLNLKVITFITSQSREGAKPKWRVRTCHPSIIGARDARNPGVHPSSQTLTSLEMMDARA
ncbi:hypothetical protein LB504_008549, partial [Fusarium proliferatum]